MECRVSLDDGTNRDHVRHAVRALKLDVLVGAEDLLAPPPAALLVATPGRRLGLGLLAKKQQGTRAGHGAVKQADVHRLLLELVDDPRRGKVALVGQDALGVEDHLLVVLRGPHGHRGL